MFISDGSILRIRTRILSPIGRNVPFRPLDHGNGYTSRPLSPLSPHLQLFLRHLHLLGRLCRLRVRRRAVCSSSPSVCRPPSVEDHVLLRRVDLRRRATLRAPSTPLPSARSVCRKIIRACDARLNNLGISTRSHPFPHLPVISRQRDRTAVTGDRFAHTCRFRFDSDGRIIRRISVWILADTRGNYVLA